MSTLGKKIGRTNVYSNLEDCLREAETTKSVNSIPYHVVFNGKEYYILSTSYTGAMVAFVRSQLDMKINPVSTQEIMKLAKKM